jgi:hypothetical protein
MTAAETFLLVEIEPRRGARHPVSADTTIGRERCDLLLDDDEVSRRHAAIRGSGAGLAIEDLGSRNGTFVNGERVDTVRPLHDGDTVRIGRTGWRFQISTERETTFGRVSAPEAVAATAEPVADPAPASGPGAGATPPADGRSGDVPAPEAAPSAVRRVPPPQAAAPPVFPTATSRRIRGSAARRGEALLASYAVVIATAAAVILYFAAR